MNTDGLAMLWLDSAERLSLAELTAVCGQSESQLMALVEAGVMSPADGTEAVWHFSADCVLTVRQAVRLRDELALDMHALALTMHLIEQIRTLKAELARVRAQQPQCYQPRANGLT